MVKEKERKRIGGIKGLKMFIEGMGSKEEEIT